MKIFLSIQFYKKPVYQKPSIKTKKRFKNIKFFVLNFIRNLKQNIAYNFFSWFKLLWLINNLLIHQPMCSIIAALIVECVRKYMDGSSQNLESLSSY